MLEQERLRIAIVQPPMAWTTAENVERIVAVLGAAAAQGATLCVFPELALTGFHRRIRDQATPALVSGAIEQVRAACREHGVACALGAPTFAGDASVRNSYLVIDSAGQVVSTVSKNGLTPAELTFFEAGTDRSVHQFAGRACTTVLCREIDDLESIALQLREARAELIFWPSIVGSPPGTIHPTPRRHRRSGLLEANGDAGPPPCRVRGAKQLAERAQHAGAHASRRKQGLCARWRGSDHAAARLRRLRRLRARRTELSLDRPRGLTTL